MRRRASWADADDAAVVTRGRSGGYWPSPAQELLLRAALLSGAAALDAWEALRPYLDPRRADRASARLLPLLGDNLRRLGVDDPVLEALDVARRETAERNRPLFEAGCRLLTTLERAGIATLVLKGGALVARAYGDPGLRAMSDLDVVVPTGRAADAVEALGRGGWAPPAAVTAAFIRMQHATDLHEGETSLKCDLHWHVYWECCGPDADDDLWAASAPLDFEGVRTRTLGPADLLLHLCVHGSRRARWPQLVWLPDALLTLRAGGIDWSRLVAQARGRRFVLRVHSMLAYLRERFEAPVPADVLAQLEASVVSRLERAEYRVANRPQGLLGELPGYWCNYWRLSDAGRVPSPLGFPRYLQQIWKLGSLAEVARRAADRARRRVWSWSSGRAHATDR